MNIEELKMVVELVRHISGDASNVALWYFGMQFAQAIIILFTLVGALTWAVHQIIKANFNQDEEFIKQCRDTLRIGSRGTLLDNERRDTYSMIRQLIAERFK